MRRKMVVSNLKEGFVARRILPTKDAIQPTLTSQHAIELLKRQLEKFDVITKFRSDDPEVWKWMDTTKGILTGTFGEPRGEPHEMTMRFSSYMTVAFPGKSDSQVQREHQEQMRDKKAVLESCI